MMARVSNTIEARLKGKKEFLYLFQHILDSFLFLLVGVENLKKRTVWKRWHLVK